LGFKGRGEGLASFDAVGDVVELGGEVGIFLAFGEHFDGTEDGQAGADEGEKLLIEDEKWFELDLAAAHSKAGTGFDGEDVVAGMGEAGSQFVGSRGGLRLLLDAATLIGQLDNELCHGSGCRLRMPAFPRYICQFSGYQLTLPVLVTDRRGKWMGRSGGRWGRGRWKWEFPWLVARLARVKEGARRVRTACILIAFGICIADEGKRIGGDHGWGFAG